MWGAIKAPHIFCQWDIQQSPTDSIHLRRPPPFHHCMGNSLALVTGLYSAAIRSAPQPVGCAGWLSCSATASCRWATSPGGDHPVPTAHRWRCRRYRRVGITPLPRVPYRAVCPHRDLTRTARFVADASGLTTLDLMHAPLSSTAFLLLSEVAMLPAPWPTRPLRSSWHVG